MPVYIRTSFITLALVSVGVATVVCLIGLFMYMPYQATFVFDNTYIQYWGFVSGVELHHYGYRTGVGFVAGVCISLLVPNPQALRWSIVTGVLLAGMTASASRLIWTVPPSTFEWITAWLWVIMHPIGAVLGGATVLLLQRVLIPHRSAL